MAKYYWESYMNNYIFKNEKELYQTIGKNIRYYRKLYSLNKRELTQENLAEIANVSTSLIGNLESKKTYQGISVYNLYKISKILEVSIDDFFIDR
jgi:transcriptional regulator with XRE-family HTH domain